MSQNIEEIKKLPFDVAGKTGITGFPNEQARMINHSLFIAYAPTEDPQIAVSVVIPGSNSEKTLLLSLHQKFYSPGILFKKRIQTKRKVH